MNNKTKEEPYPLPNEVKNNLPKHILKNLDVLKMFYIPKNTMSSHQHISVKSDTFKRLQQIQLETLSIFHTFAEENDILYSLHGGSLMGYYWHKKMIPWDDDIDIIVRQSDITKIYKLWKSGKPIKSQKYNRGYDNKHTRIIQLNNEDYEIMKNDTLAFNKNFHRTLFKLRPVKHDCFHNVPGGIDIIYCYMAPNGILIDSWTPSRIAAGPTIFDPKEKFPEVDFNGVKTRAILPQFGKPFLDIVYTPKWRIKCHPRLKFPNQNIN